MVRFVLLVTSGLMIADPNTALIVNFTEAAGGSNVAGAPAVMTAMGESNGKAESAETSQEWSDAEKVSENYGV